MTERVNRMGRVPIELTVLPEPGNGSLFRVCWPDGKLQYLGGDVHLSGIPDIWLDLIPFLTARVLLSHGYDADRPYVVRLRGADYVMLRTTLWRCCCHAAGQHHASAASAALHLQ